MNSHCFTLNRSYSFSFNLSNFLGLNPKERYLSLEKENFCVVLLHKAAYEIRKFMSQSFHGGWEMYKKRDARAKLLFCWYKLIAFQLFSLPSSLLKLPIVEIQKFCYHGNVTSHISSLLGNSLLTSEVIAPPRNLMALKVQCLLKQLEAFSLLFSCSIFSPKGYCQLPLPQLD